jgi:hypothetical protein
VAALGSPIIDGVTDALLGENIGELIGWTTMLPRTTAGDQVNVARGELVVIPGIREIGEVVDGIVEIEIIVVHPVHEILKIIDARHGETMFEDVGMFEKRIGGVIGTEGRTHGGDRDLGLAIIPDERNNLLAKIGIEGGLHVAAMKWMSAPVVETEAVNGIDAEQFDAAAVNKIGKRADHALAFEFPFVAGAGGEAEKRLAPMAVNHHAEFEAQARRVPAMVFTLHVWNPSKRRQSSMTADASEGQ